MSVLPKIATPNSGASDAKFKVGDRVTVTESFSGAGNKKLTGKTGTITAIYSSDETLEVNNGIGRIAPEFVKKA